VSLIRRIVTFIIRKLNGNGNRKSGTHNIAASRDAELATIGRTTAWVYFTSWEATDFNPPVAAVEPAEENEREEGGLHSDRGGVVMGGMETNIQRILCFNKITGKAAVSCSTRGLGLGYTPSRDSQG
jgi:hypothetical protein